MDQHKSSWNISVISVWPWIREELKWGLLEAFNLVAALGSPLFYIISCRPDIKFIIGYFYLQQFFDLTITYLRLSVQVSIIELGE